MKDELLDRFRKAQRAHRSAIAKHAHARRHAIGTGGAEWLMEADRARRNAFYTLSWAAISLARAIDKKARESDR